ncbi:hypothetical protein [Imperialibacter roseus]|uniref:Uncharacterized protein n=1 Tax=Imperialibacter roseus TaxID=1324217 RepID=A0ABZ0IWC8_9BACT|nr:hypothetical protein [Imperialibacter roseus]WOK07942.1 hypothetical protein RT717_04775 [Imperialibacter roseus]|tara:strand:- start:2535 stop:2741 length:207 start_codon:yes stop_codon:yes gene_type:complete
MTTIKIKKTDSSWKKTSFEDPGDLLDYLLENFQIGKLLPLSKEDATEKRKKDCEEVETMNDEDFIDIR